MSTILITSVLGGFITPGDWIRITVAFVVGGVLVGLVVYKLLQVRLLRAAHAAASHERRRVARDLHDGVSHGLVVMAMHARRLRTGPVPAAHRQAAEIIDGVAQATLADLNTTLGILRSEEGTALPPVEEPGEGGPFTSRLLQLTRQLPQSRLVLELHDPAEEHRVPPGVAATAFRVAQEALTNALKHNGGRMHLGVRFGDELVITFTNEVWPTGVPGLSWPRGGLGLAGLRERLAAHGGLVDAGPLPDGRFITRAIIPVSREDEVCTVSAY